MGGGGGVQYLFTLHCSCFEADEDASLSRAHCLWELHLSLLKPTAPLQQIPSMSENLVLSSYKQI